MEKIKIQRVVITSGRAAGKCYNLVDGYGSFQTIYYCNSIGCTSTAYIAHSNFKVPDVLCNTLMDVAKHLGVDCDELVNALPKTYDLEREF